MSLFDSYKVTIVATSTAEATTAVESDSVVMGDYSEVAFLATLGTPAVDNILKVQSSANNSDWTDITGAVVVPGETDANQYVCCVNVPATYVRAVVTRDTATTVDSIIAFRGQAGRNPQTNNTAGAIVGTVKVG
jgi:hypothetical protein